MTDLSTAPASDMDSPADHDAADVSDVGDSAAPVVGSQPDTASSVLARLEEAGWRSIDGQAAGQRGIDHIAIGPSGVFVIDNHLLDAAGAAGQPTAGSVSDDAITAANQLADVVRQLLPPLTRQYVVPVLAYVATLPMSISRGPVQICTTSMLQRVIESRPAALSSREIAEVSGVLSAGLGGSAPAAERLAPTPTYAEPPEARRATPKRRKLGWRGGQTEDTQAPAIADATPPMPTAWPAVTAPPAWEPAEVDAPVAAPAPSFEGDPEAGGHEPQVDEPEPYLEPESQDVEAHEPASADSTDEAVGVDDYEPASIATVEPTTVFADLAAPEISADDALLADDEPADEAAQDPAEEPPEAAADDLIVLDVPAPETTGSHEADLAPAAHSDDKTLDGIAAELAIDRDALVGSFPVGWNDADPVAHALAGEDEVESDDKSDDEPSQPIESAPSDEPVAVAPTSPWPSIRLPEPTDVEPDLEIDLDPALDSVVEPDRKTLLDVELDVAEPIAEPERAIDVSPALQPDATHEPSSAPTVVGRTQPGGRRRAPTAPWHARLMPRSRPKPTRAEGARRAQPTAETLSDEAAVPVAGPTVIEGVSTPATRSRRPTKARPQTLSARSGSLTRDDAEPQPRRARQSGSRAKAGTQSPLSGVAPEPPTGLSSRGRQMYAAMSARQIAAADEVENEPKNVGAPIRRLVVGGIAAGLLIASGTHVTSISGWVADHVHIPGVGDTSGKHHPKDDNAPGRSANLESPDSGTGGNGDGGKPPKP